MTDLFRCACESGGACTQVSACRANAAAERLRAERDQLQETIAYATRTLLDYFDPDVRNTPLEALVRAALEAVVERDQLQERVVAIQAAAKDAVRVLHDVYDAGGGEIYCDCKKALRRSGGRVKCLYCRARQGAHALSSTMEGGSHDKISDREEPADTGYCGLAGEP